MRIGTHQPFLVSHFSNSRSMVTLPCARDPVFPTNNHTNEHSVSLTKPVSPLTSMSIHPRSIPVHMLTLKPIETQAAVTGMQDHIAQTSSYVEGSSLLSTEVPQTCTLSQSGIAMATQHQPHTHLVTTIIFPYSYSSFI